MTTSTREPPTYDVRMAQFVLKIEKLSHILGARGSQDLRSPSPIMAPDRLHYPDVRGFLGIHGQGKEGGGCADRIARWAEVQSRNIAKGMCI